MSSTCPSCGREFATGERYCPDDGVRLDVSDTATTTPIPPDPLIGRVLDGRYKIEQKLGEGGMGAVYRATHTMMEKALAVKVLRAHMSSDDVATRRFQREAKSASRLDHQHCIRVTDFGQTEDGLLFLAMEFLAGRTLGEDLYVNGPMPARRAAHVARQVALALAHAHDLNIIHRDLKPDNVFLTTRDGQADFVKVLDFGLAKLHEREVELDEHGAPRTMKSLTETGIVFGTPEYMSPEQAEGRPLDPRTDLYSLGCVMYQMLSTQLPFNAPTFMALLTKHLTEPVPILTEARPDLSVPPALAALVARLMDKEPANRPQDARQVAAALEAMDLAPPSGRVPREIAVHPTVPVASAGGAALTAGPAPPPASPAPPPPGGAGPYPEPTPSEELLAARRPGRALVYALVPLLLAGAGLLYWIGTRKHPAADEEPAVVTPADAARAAVAPPVPDAGTEAAPADAAPAARAPDAARAGSARPNPGGNGRDSATEHLRQARLEHQKGNKIQELVHLQAAVAAAPNNATALYLLGQAVVSDDQKLGCKYLKRAARIKAAKELYDKVGCGLVDP